MIVFIKLFLSPSSLSHLLCHLHYSLSSVSLLIYLFCFFVQIIIICIITIDNHL